MSGERADRQLDVIAETASLAHGLGIDVWLRGGWAMDFYLGEITRDHEDVDWFAWADHAPTLETELLNNGYVSIPGAPRKQQLDFRKGGVESSFVLLRKNGDGQVLIAGGPWEGEPWPEAGMVHDRLGTLNDVNCEILDPRAQVQIKRMMPIWDPRRPFRQKDADDVHRLEARFASVWTD